MFEKKYLIDFMRDGSLPDIHDRGISGVAWEHLMMSPVVALATCRYKKSSNSGYVTKVGASEPELGVAAVVGIPHAMGQAYYVLRFDDEATVVESTVAHRSKFDSFLKDDISRIGGLNNNSGVRTVLDGAASIVYHDNEHHAETLKMVEDTWTRIMGARGDTVVFDECKKRYYDNSKDMLDGASALTLCRGHDGVFHTIIHATPDKLVKAPVELAHDQVNMRDKACASQVGILFNDSREVSIEDYQHGVAWSMEVPYREKESGSHAGWLALKHIWSKMYSSTDLKIAVFHKDKVGIVAAHSAGAPAAYVLHKPEHGASRHRGDSGRQLVNKRAANADDDVAAMLRDAKRADVEGSVVTEMSEKDFDELVARLSLKVSVRRL